MLNDKLHQELLDKYFKVQRKYNDALNVLYVFDDKPEVQELLKKHGLWNKSDTSEKPVKSTD